MKEFQHLASQVRLPEEHLIDIFFNGLKKEMKEVIKMKEPKSLPEHIAAIIMMEDSEFCKMLTTQKTQDFKSNHQGTQSQFKTMPSSGNQNWKAKSTVAESSQKLGEKPGITKTGDNHQGQVKLSDADYKYKKKNGLCFKCLENGHIIMCAETNNFRSSWYLRALKLS